MAERSLELARQPMGRSLAGSLGYALTMADALERLGAEVDVFTPTDAGLAATLAIESPDDSEFDLVNGSAGRLVYLSQRPNSAVNASARARVLEQLSTALHRDARGVWWERPGEARQDLTLAHGQAGVVAGLAALVSSDVGAGERERQWVSDAVRFLVAHQASRPSPYFFSSSVGSSASRLAWCTGDLGTALALWQAGQALNRDDLRALGVRVAEHAAGVSADASNVVDASVCHGAAGAGLVFATLAHQMNNQTLRDASARWFSRVTEYRRARAPLVFQFKCGPVWEDNPSLLEGVAGIGLALEAACTPSPTPPRWARWWCLG